MHDTAPFGGVTSSAPRRPQAGGDQKSDDSADSRAATDPAPLPGDLRADVEHRSEERSGPEKEAADQAGIAHAATLRASAGNVELNGDVVDRLRPHLCEITTVELDEHLLGVARMVRASIALGLLVLALIVPAATSAAAPPPPLHHADVCLLVGGTAVTVASRQAVPGRADVVSSVSFNGQRPQMSWADSKWEIEYAWHGAIVTVSALPSRRAPFTVRASSTRADLVHVYVRLAWR